MAFLAYFFGKLRLSELFVHLLFGIAGDVLLVVAGLAKNQSSVVVEASVD